MKKYFITLLALTLSSCITLKMGQNGSPGKNGSNAIGTEIGKGGAHGQNG